MTTFSVLKMKMEVHKRELQYPMLISIYLQKRIAIPYVNIYNNKSYNNYKLNYNVNEVISFSYENV